LNYATIKHKLLNMSAGDTAKWSAQRDPWLRTGRGPRAPPAEPQGLNPRTSIRD